MGTVTDYSDAVVDYSSAVIHRAAAAATEDSGRAIEGEGTTEAQWQAWGGLQRLAPLDAATLVPPGHRAVVVAPHPDDEILMVGGLFAALARAGRALAVVAVTDGTASHPGSQLWPAERLADARPRETRLALQRLAIDADPLRLALPDGGVRGQCRELAHRLASLLLPSDVVFTTWRHDGHPDHEATGVACAAAVACVGARLVEVPVWAWHWAVPGDARLPWHRARRVPLDAATAARKQHATAAFESQVLPDPSTGAGPILRATTVARAARPYEVVLL